jgi:hypothetical protein
METTKKLLRWIWSTSEQRGIVTRSRGVSGLSGGARVRLLREPRGHLEGSESLCLPRRSDPWGDFFQRRSVSVGAAECFADFVPNARRTFHYLIGMFSLLKYAISREFTDSELDNEAGEYFEVNFTRLFLPGAFKDPEDLKRRVLEAEITHLSVEQLHLQNSDVGEVLRKEDPTELAHSLAQEYGRDLERIEQGIAIPSAIPPAIVLRDRKGKLGYTRLMGGAATGFSMPVKIVDVDSEYKSVHEVVGTTRMENVAAMKDQHLCNLNSKLHTKPPAHTGESPCGECCHRCVGTCAVPKWLVEVYEAVAEHRVRPAIDILFEHMDDLFLEGRFQEADKILSLVDVEKLDENLMVGFLTITSAAKDHLNNRDALYRQIEDRLGQKLTPGELNSLLQGLN